MQQLPADASAQRPLCSLFVRPSNRDWGVSKPPLEALRLDARLMHMQTLRCAGITSCFLVRQLQSLRRKHCTQVYNLNSPAAPHKELESPLKYQTRCITCFADHTGFMVRHYASCVGACCLAAIEVQQHVCGSCLSILQFLPYTQPLSTLQFSCSRPE